MHGFTNAECCVMITEEKSERKIRMEGRIWHFLSELIITVVKMVFLMAVAVLGVKAGHALRVRKEKK